MKKVNPELTISIIGGYTLKPENLKKIENLLLELQDLGYNQETKEHTLIIKTRRENFDKIIQFAKKNDLKAKITDEISTRSEDYRTAFFDYYKNLEYYRCTYCHKIICKSIAEVDHVYPVNAVQTNLKIYDRFYKRGKSVNDISNLVISCHKCNTQKGSKMGIWLFKGKLRLAKRAVASAIYNNNITRNLLNLICILLSPIPVLGAFVLLRKLYVMSLDIEWLHPLGSFLGFFF